MQVPGPHSPQFCGGTRASGAQFSAEQPLCSGARGNRDAPAPPAVPLRRRSPALFAVGLGEGRGRVGGERRRECHLGHFPAWTHPVPPSLGIRSAKAVGCVWTGGCA